MAKANKKPRRRADKSAGEAKLHAVSNGSETIPSKLDKLIHERVRLAIISGLAANESLSFNELKRLVQTSDGNISVHARKLEDAGYLTCEKSFEGRRPLTEYRITRKGEAALSKYLDHMDALIQAVKGDV